MAHLSDNNVALRGSSSFDVLIQDVLWHLSGLSTARGPTDNHDWIAVDGLHDLLFKLFDGQLLSFMQPLPKKQKLTVSTLEKAV